MRDYPSKEQNPCEHGRPKAICGECCLIPEETIAEAQRFEQEALGRAIQIGVPVVDRPEFIIRCRTFTLAVLDAAAKANPDHPCIPNYQIINLFYWRRDR